jgi:hypothetical protein
MAKKNENIIFFSCIKIILKYYLVSIKSFGYLCTSNQYKFR